MSEADDERAERFTCLYQECYPVVLAYARRRIEEQLARDVAAEVFLVAWRRLDQVPVPPLPWLLGTARLVLANSQRGLRRAERHHGRAGSLAAGAAVPDHAEAVVERDRVLEVLRQLPASDRELLLLVAWEDLDTATAARVIGCSAAAARVRLFRARRRLRSRLLADPPPITSTPTIRTEAL